MKKIVFALALIIAVTVSAQAVSTGKVIMVSEDTVVSKDIDVAEIDIDIAGIVEEALDGIEGDIPREEIVKKLRVRLGEDHPGVHRMERRIEKRSGCSDYDKSHCAPFFHQDFSKSHPGNECKPAMVLGVFMNCAWRIVVLIMWIITLFVVGRGFSKIARNNQQSNG